MNWHREHEPNINVRTNLHDNMQAPVVSAQIEEKLAEIEANLPLGISFETGCAIEELAKGGASVA